MHANNYNVLMDCNVVGLMICRFVVCILDV